MYVCVFYGGNCVINCLMGEKLVFLFVFVFEGDSQKNVQISQETNQRNNLESSNKQMSTTYTF